MLGINPQNWHFAGANRTFKPERHTMQILIAFKLLSRTWQWSMTDRCLAILAPSALVDTRHNIRYCRWATEMWLVPAVDENYLGHGAIFLPLIILSMSYLFTGFQITKEYSWTLYACLISFSRYNDLLVYNQCYFDIFTHSSLVWDPPK